VIKIGEEGCPTTTAVLENAHGLARYAQICQVRREGAEG
jgi:fructose-bisphosphate aldolase class I